MDPSSPLTLSLAFGAAAAAANVVGGLVVVARRHWNEMFLKYFLGLGAGFMLAATFLRMIPASIALSSSAPVLILAGYFLVQFFEHTLAPHFHFRRGEPRRGDGEPGRRHLGPGRPLHPHLLRRRVDRVRLPRAPPPWASSSSSRWSSTRSPKG
jgi:zinc transporter ZupT